jgi:hypothetical protein
MRIHAVRRTLLAAAAVSLLAPVLGADPGTSGTGHDKHKNDAKHEQQQAKRADKQQQQAERKQAVAQRQAHQRHREQIAAQRARNASYDRRLIQQKRVLARRAEPLRAANRLAQYRYQQEYVARLHQQQLALQQAHDYENDPYYTTAPAYRYSRGGRSYQVNQYAADVLTQAVNQGYEQGVRAGQADEQDRFSRGRFLDSYAYQDATYGFDGRYVALDEYQYYFREGFRRGYEDGRGTSLRYGSNAGGRPSLLANVLSAILTLQSLR